MAAAEPAKLKEIDPTVPDSLVFNPGDFVSSQVVVEKIISTFDGSAAAQFLGGQNPYGAFASMAPGVADAGWTSASESSPAPAASTSRRVVVVPCWAMVSCLFIAM